MSQRFVVVYEARADFTTATELADRELVDAIDWLDESLLDSQRQWVGESPDRRKLIWTSIDDLARQRGGMLGFRIAGHFGGEPAQPDARAARRAVRVLRHVFGDDIAIVLIRDADDQGERRQGLQQARDEHHGLPIAIGLAVRMREAWVLCGFEPEDDRECGLLSGERQELGFDPRERSHELTAKQSSRKGAADAAAFPLIKPDVRISRIRLARELLA